MGNRGGKSKAEEALLSGEPKSVVSNRVQGASGGFLQLSRGSEGSSQFSNLLFIYTRQNHQDDSAGSYLGGRF